ncbi:hypothetical protein ACFPJ1_02250 [Kribbella qitaiheensis]
MAGAPLDLVASAAERTDDGISVSNMTGKHFRLFGFVDGFSREISPST